MAKLIEVVWNLRMYTFFLRNSSVFVFDISWMGQSQKCGAIGTRTRDSDAVGASKPDDRRPVSRSKTPNDRFSGFKRAKKSVGKFSQFAKYIARVFDFKILLTIFSPIKNLGTAVLNICHLYKTQHPIHSHPKVNRSIELIFPNSCIFFSWIKIYVNVFFFSTRPNFCIILGASKFSPHFMK